MSNKNRGGARQGAGRKVNSGRYGEKTKTLRIPASKEDEIKEFIRSGFSLNVSVPYSSIYVSAGEPFSFEEHENVFIDLCVYMKKNKNIVALTVSGDSMIGLGIHDGDLALVEKGASPQHNDVVIAYISGGYTLKQYVVDQHQIILKAHHPDVSDILVLPELDISIYGVMKSLIRRYL